MHRNGARVARRGATRNRTRTTGTSPRGLPGGPPPGASTTTATRPPNPPVATHALRILAGEVDAVITTLHQQATDAGLTPQQRGGVDTCIGYLQAKRELLGYDTALQAGWPIATGVIEGACRHLIGDRLDITGARWGLQGAEAVLKLRALTSNGDFDTYWAFHLTQEHRRVHQARYQHPLARAA